MTLYQILSLCGIPSLIMSFVLFLLNFFKYKTKEFNQIKKGMVAILHNLVYTQGMSYIQRGMITMSEMKDYEYLYHAYNSLGGNGTGTEIYNRVKKLPIQ